MKHVGIFWGQEISMKGEMVMHRVPYLFKDDCLSTLRSYWIQFQRMHRVNLSGGIDNVCSNSVCLA